MKNWKTTICGLVAAIPHILQLLAPAIIINPAIAEAVSACAVAVGLIFAADSTNVRP